MFQSSWWGVRDAQTNHVIEAGRTQLCHHRLGEGSPWGLKESKHGVVRPERSGSASVGIHTDPNDANVPEFPGIVETNFLGPYPKHPPKGYKDCSQVRNRELKSPHE